MIITLFLAISDLLLSILIWIITLQKLDQFMEQKIPYNYQWISN
ncbi:MAG: hypothetical protein Q8784_01635 [Vigna little leaf phytoplasma]|nr:hypothetical protein [Vigna little leaf phytoplasma]